MSCSEIRFSKESIPREQLIYFARKIRERLSQIIYGGKVVVYISLFEDEIELRFHRHRENEKTWLADDLNIYSNPIMRVM